MYSYALFLRPLNKLGSNVEAGRQNATLDTLVALAKALDVQPKDLITATAPKRHTGRSTKQPARGSQD